MEPKDRILTRISIVAALSILSACSAVPTTPPQAQAVVIPDAWSTSLASEQSGAHAGAALADWWGRFGDPVLATLVRQAMRANDSIGAAQSALRQARALRDGAAAPLLPGVSYRATAQRDQADSGARRAFGVGIDAAWEADLFGANRYGLRAAEANAQAALATLGSVQVSIAAEVALAYIQLRGGQARLAIARDNLASQLETLQITGWRVQAGLLTSLEGEQARAASEQTQAQIPTLEANIAQFQHALAVLCGQPPAALSAQLARAEPIPQPRDDLALSLPLDTLRQRPDVAAAGHQVGAAFARVGQADAARYPNLKLSGSVGLDAMRLGALGNAALARSVLASLSGPLFDGGSARAQVRAQQAALDQARLAYRATVLAALKEVEDALSTLGGDRTRLRHLRNAAEAAANADLLARQRYAGGLVDFQTVLDVQRSLLGLQDAVAATSADLSADHVRLYKALGGGWQPEPPLLRAAP
jgi:multidrug efflux system outer membrane protein